MAESMTSDESYNPDPSPDHSTVDEVSPISEHHARDIRATPNVHQVTPTLPVPRSQTPIVDSRQDDDLASHQAVIASSPPQIHPKLQANPYALESTYFTRPNRYFGPESTWLSWTEAERTTVTSIDRLRATNLSVHLFNAFALNHQGEHLQHEPAKDHNMSSAAQSASHEIAMPPTFRAPKIWTAWPLPPNEVPRVDFHVRSIVTESSLYSCRRRKPSSELQACLVAVAAKIARHQWEQRTWASEELTFDDRFVAERHEKLGLEDVEHDALGDMPSDGTEEKSRSSTGSTTQDESVSTADAQLTGAKGVQYFSSQAFGAPSLSTTNDADAAGSIAASDKPPVYSADDERIERLLRPSCRHIVAALSDLLRAVHDSRKYYAYGQGPQSRSRSQSTARSQDGHLRSTHGEGTGTEVQEKISDSRGCISDTRRRSVSLTRPLSSPVKRESSPMTSFGSDAKQSLRSPSATLQLHDWSAVIGLASVVGGFSPDTVARAGERCARLFQENMSFRTFQEAVPTDNQETIPDKLYEHSEARPVFEEYFAAVDDPELSTVSAGYDEDQQQPSTSVDIVRACARCYRLKQKCSISISPDQHEAPQSCQRCLKDKAECIGLQVRREQLKPEPQRRSLCPHTDCERHISGFLRDSHLKRHLTVVHGPDVKLRHPDPTVHSTQDQLKGSPNAGPKEIYCPVDGCARAQGRQPFSRGNKLYEHIKRMHPTLDVNEVKKVKVARRGEWRGRQADSQRHESRSRDPASSSSRHQNLELSNRD